MKQYIADAWQKLPEHWQSQVKKAGLASAVAFATVIAAPLISPFHQLQKAHLPKHTAGHAHGASHHGKAGPSHWKGGHSHG